MSKASSLAKTFDSDDLLTMHTKTVIRLLRDILLIFYQNDPMSHH